VSIIGRDLVVGKRREASSPAHLLMQERRSPFSDQNIREIAHPRKEISLSQIREISFLPQKGPSGFPYCVDSTVQCMAKLY
jgi:hypothetical protein